MNEMAMVEYLLQEYAEYSAKAADAKRRKDQFDYAYYDGKADLAFAILQERFSMKIYETGDEYIACNSVCSVRVRIQNENQSN